MDFLKYPLELLEREDVPERFAVVYQLTSLEHNARLRVKAYVPEEPCEIATATELWPAANWAEREVYDLYGIRFTGHPDLRRILMPENYQGHPLRKDYPLKGRGERDHFPKYTEIPER
jgi:NADH-quinone oxidoreductase subunit C